ncbi:MAG TPA: hypothetical protein VKZ76_08840 [Edaphocola sp.]|nr:hypothetical protein [Edaphocola sp.]
MRRTLQLALVCCLAILISACGFEERKQALDARESALVQREQELLLREKMLIQLEDSVRQSIARKDSTEFMLQQLGIALPDSLAGVWTVNMMCTQTNCTGFAVGDIRKETWVFEQEDSASTVYVKAMQGETLIRIYSGIFDGADFVLSTPIGNEAQSGKMNVKLNLNTASKLTGQRVIYQPDGCTTTFKVDAERNKKQ